jgi:hypothetical protein
LNLREAFIDFALATVCDFSPEKRNAAAARFFPSLIGRCGPNAEEKQVSVQAHKALTSIARNYILTGVSSSVPARNGSTLNPQQLTGRLVLSSQSPFEGEKKRGHKDANQLPFTNSL